MRETLFREPNKLLEYTDAPEYGFNVARVMNNEHDTSKLLDLALISIKIP